MLIYMVTKIKTEGRLRNNRMYVLTEDFGRIIPGQMNALIGCRSHTELN